MSHSLLGIVYPFRIFQNQQVPELSFDSLSIFYISYVLSLIYHQLVLEQLVLQRNQT